MQQRTSRFARVLSATAIAGAMLFAVTAEAAQPAQSAQSASAVQAVGDSVAINITGKITRIFADTNSAEVKGPKGNLVVIDVDPNIADVKKLKVGDEVHVAYRGALLMSADKVDPKGAEARMTAQSTLPASGGVVVKTAGVQVVAVIQKIDAKTREVTLAGPKRVVTMQVQPDVQLDKFKVGDSVLATYVGATAIDVTRNGQIVK
jgi:Cu/Ag efflux protein CusF